MASKYPFAIVGLGVIGLPYTGILAREGHKVLGVDVSARRIDEIRDRSHTMGEPPVTELVLSALDQGLLDLATEPQPSETYVIAVPTPLESVAKRADLSHVIDAARSIAAVASPGELVIVESTVPPGTLRKTVAAIFEEAGKSGVLLAHAPERLLPGDVLYELENNDRVVGGLTEEATQAAARIYRSFVRGEVFETDADTAEMVKIFENTCRDIEVATANELALIARNAGVDPHVAISLANRHPRVNILEPGIGVGGHCLPVDPWFLHEIDPESAVLVATARRVNDAVPVRVAREVQLWFSGTGASRLLLVGKSYKAGAWDPKESPALEIADDLAVAGLTVESWDPLEPGNPEPPSVDADTAVLLLVGHQQARSFVEQATAAKARASAIDGTVVDLQ